MWCEHGPSFFCHAATALKNFGVILPTPWLYTLRTDYTFFISNTRLKLTKNKAKAEQHPEAEICYFNII